MTTIRMVDPATVSGDHYTTLNTLSEGMQIESDIRPPG